MNHLHRGQDDRLPGLGTPAEPVFTDPSGQRRRRMRLAGAAASVLLVGAILLVGLGLAGGPDTPFHLFGPPRAQAPGHGSAAGKGKHRPGSTAPGASGPSSTRPSPGTDPSAGSPSPKGSRSGSPAPSASASPTPTNPAGRTPPGQTRSPSPHPHPSPTPHAL